MDIFKFLNPTSPTKMEQGEILSGFTSKMWIERYRDAGEFTLTAPVSSGMKDKLPLGTFISHTNTPEIMIVENHEINEKAGEDSSIVITGRGYETYLESRIVGSNKFFPATGPFTDYTLTAAYTWAQAVALLIDHIYLSNLADYTDTIPFLSIIQGVTTGTGTTLDRPIKPGSLYTALLDLLAIDNCGIKVIRPGPWSPVDGHGPDTAFVIHQGSNLTSSVVYSYESGQIETADYLWSNKEIRNAALIIGKWVETRVVSTETDYARRWMLVDASDIDNGFTELPTGATLDAVISGMQIRGTEALSNQNYIHLVKADVSKSASQPVYRVDFNVGDIVATMGNYQEGSVMRVSEYVEIEDQNGESGYPTIAVD